MSKSHCDAPATDLLAFAGSTRFSTVLADPPWRFINRTGKMAPEHRRLSRYGTMTVEEIARLPVSQIVNPTARPQRSASGRSAGFERLGLPLQVKYRLA